MFILACTNLSDMTSLLMFQFIRKKKKEVMRREEKRNVQMGCGRGHGIKEDVEIGKDKRRRNRERIKKEEIGSRFSAYNTG